MRDPLWCNGSTSAFGAVRTGFESWRRSSWNDRRVDQLTIPVQADYALVTFDIAFGSFAEVQEREPELLRAHVSEAYRRHADGSLLLAGSLTPHDDGGLRTMCLLRTRGDAEDFIAHDPFVTAGYVRSSSVQSWGNMFNRPG